MSKVMFFKGHCPSIVRNSGEVDNGIDPPNNSTGSFLISAKYMADQHGTREGSSEWVRRAGKIPISRPTNDRSQDKKNAQPLNHTWTDIIPYLPVIKRFSSFSPCELVFEQGLFKKNTILKFGLDSIEHLFDMRGIAGAAVSPGDSIPTRLINPGKSSLITKSPELFTRTLEFGPYAGTYQERCPLCGDKKEETFTACLVEPGTLISIDPG